MFVVQSFVQKSLVSKFAEEKSFSVSEQVSNGEELMPALLQEEGFEKSWRGTNDY